MQSLSKWLGAQEVRLLDNETWEPCAQLAHCEVVPDSEQLVVYEEVEDPPPRTAPAAHSQPPPRLTATARPRPGAMSPTCSTVVSRNTPERRGRMDSLVIGQRVN